MKKIIIVAIGLITLTGQLVFFAPETTNDNADTQWCAARRSFMTKTVDFDYGYGCI